MLKHAKAHKETIFTVHINLCRILPSSTGKARVTGLKVKVVARHWRQEIESVRSTVETDLWDRGDPSLSSTSLLSRQLPLPWTPSPEAGAGYFSEFRTYGGVTVNQPLGSNPSRPSPPISPFPSTLLSHPPIPRPFPSPPLEVGPFNLAIGDLREHCKQQKLNLVHFSLKIWHLVASTKFKDFPENQIYDQISCKISKFYAEFGKM